MEVRNSEADKQYAKSDVQIERSSSFKSLQELETEDKMDIHEVIEEGSIYDSKESHQLIQVKDDDAREKDVEMEIHEDIEVGSTYDSQGSHQLIHVEDAEVIEEMQNASVEDVDRHEEGTSLHEFIKQPKIWGVYSSFALAGLVFSLPSGPGVFVLFPLWILVLTFWMAVWWQLQKHAGLGTSHTAGFIAFLSAYMISHGIWYFFFWRCCAGTDPQNKCGATEKNKQDYPTFRKRFFYPCISKCMPKERKKEEKQKNFPERGSTIRATKNFKDANGKQIVEGDEFTIIDVGNSYMGVTTKTGSYYEIDSINLDNIELIQSKNNYNTYIHKKSSVPRHWFSKSAYDATNQQLYGSEINQIGKQNTNITSTPPARYGMDTFKSLVSEVAFGPFAYYDNFATSICICVLVYMILDYFFHMNRRSTSDTVAVIEGKSSSNSDMVAVREGEDQEKPFVQSNNPYEYVLESQDDRTDNQNDYADAPDDHAEIALTTNPATIQDPRAASVLAQKENVDAAFPVKKNT